jgi:hypothetical protein
MEGRKESKEVETKEKALEGLKEMVKEEKKEGNKERKEQKNTLVM